MPCSAVSTGTNTCLHSTAWHLHHPLTLAYHRVDTQSCELQQQVDGLAKRKAELQAEGQKPLVGPEEQRAALLAQIKADNEACEMAVQKAKQATESIRQLERQGITAQPARYSQSP